MKNRIIIFELNTGSLWKGDAETLGLPRERIGEDTLKGPQTKIDLHLGARHHLEALKAAKGIFPSCIYEKEAVFGVAVAFGLDSFFRIELVKKDDKFIKCLQEIDEWGQINFQDNYELIFVSGIRKRRLKLQQKLPNAFFILAEKESQHLLILSKMLRL